jgi:hypothetical protein
MNSQSDIPPALNDCNQHLRAIVEQFIRLVDGLISVTIENETVKDIRTEDTPILNSVAQVLPLMLQALGSSSYTLTRLSGTSGLHTRDCYSIVRSIVEIAVNICYILAEGSTAADRAIRHAKQKSYQDLKRESEINNAIIQAAYSSRPDPSTIDGLEADIAEFTSRTGREKGWVDLSIDMRIEVAGRKLGDSVLNSLHFARFMIYRHSSEILHGTFFSALYFFGITSPTNKQRTQNEAIEFIGQQHMLILFAAILALSAVIESFHLVYGFSRAYEQSRVLIKSIHEIPYIQESDHKFDPGVT